jgi:lipopolysaccharide transport system ATP-binding protein
LPMSSNDIAIRVNNLSKRYEIYEAPRDRLKQFILPVLQRKLGRPSKQYFRDFWALKDVSFEVKKGETIGIIGRNGCGKSTLLQMICGTLTPTNGTIQTNGRIAALLELGSGFNPEFTGRENVYMNAAVLGLSKLEIEERYDDIVAFADIGKHINQPVKTYSSGMYVRLAFAVAIHAMPDVFIVDEALSVGDIRFQTKCIRAIKKIKEQGCAILFVSHSAGQIEALCDRTIWLNEGIVKAEGTPSNLMRRYVNYIMHDIDEEVADNTLTTSVAGISEKTTPINALWTDLTSKNNIKGSLSTVITKIMVQQLNKNSVNILPVKPQKLNVAIVAEVHSYIDKPLLAIGIFNSLNEPIVHFNTENAQKHLEPLMVNTDYIFEFSFDIPALRPGEYLISVGIDNGISGASEVLCHVYDAWSFVVVANQSEKPQAGYIQIENIKETITNIGNHQ